VIIVFFAVSIIRQQRRYIALQKANALAEITAMEKERARIAADLHDDLGPLLSVVKFRVDHVEVVQADEKLELDKASGQLDELIGRLREVANDLMPSILQRKGLFPAIEEYINNIQSTNALRIDMEDLSKSPVSENKIVHIYRIIQETIHNCLKHAKASRLTISFAEANGWYKISCRDDGRGFDVTQVLKDSMGIGMRSLKNRTEMLGGRMQVESKPGKGSQFIYEIPVK
jgi:signal transduction histidine kinase